MVTPEDRIKEYVWGLLTTLANAEAEVARLTAEVAALKACPVHPGAPVV